MIALSLAKPEAWSVIAKVKVRINPLRKMLLILDEVRMMTVNLLRKCEVWASSKKSLRKRFAKRTTDEERVMGFDGDVYKLVRGRKHCLNNENNPPPVPSNFGQAIEISSH